MPIRIKPKPISTDTWSVWWLLTHCSVSDQSRWLLPSGDFNVEGSSFISSVARNLSPPISYNPCAGRKLAITLQFTCQLYSLYSAVHCQFVLTVLLHSRCSGCYEITLHHSWSQPQSALTHRYCCVCLYCVKRKSLENSPFVMSQYFLTGVPTLTQWYFLPASSCWSIGWRKPSEMLQVQCCCKRLQTVIVLFSGSLLMAYW